MTPDPALHPSTFIEEMIQGREWTVYDLAARMNGDMMTNLAMLEAYSKVGPTDQRCRLGVTAASLSHAFGLPITFFVRLEALWLASAKP